jgi:NAD(P)-dependent dehydrogenase (short-subunit alcohol dehydrogenase family)
MPIFAADALAGHHAIITGASGGIGQAVSRCISDMGAAVTLTGRNINRLSVLQQSILQENPDVRIRVIPADLRKSDERKSLIEEAEQQLGPITLLVNNAGTYRFGIVEEETEETLRQMLDVNFTSAVLLTQLVYQGMKARRKGAIVNVSSLSGLRGGYGQTAYSASKFALIGFTHSFALEAIRHNVRVNAVCPGYVDTDMGYDVIGAQAAVSGATLEQQIERTNAGIPSGRITTPEEVAHSIAFLLTDAAHNIIGESLKISGGALLR